MAVMAAQSSQAGLFFDLTNDSDLEVEQTSYSSSDSSSLSTSYSSPSSSSSSASSASSSSSEDEVEWLSSSKGRAVSRGKSIPIEEGNERVSLEDSRSEPLGNVKANPSSSRRLEKAEDTTDEDEEGRYRKRRRMIRNEDSAGDSDVEFVRVVTTKEPESKEKEPELISSESESERRHRRIEELTYEALFGRKESEHKAPSASSTSSTSSSTSRKHPPIVIDLSADDSEAESSAPKIVAEEEDVCPICLGDFQDPAIPDGCKHTFCFVCILQWSEINPNCLCPLCKSHFTALYHDIQSSTDFKRYKIEPPKPAPKPSHHPSYLRRSVRTQPNQYRGRPRRWPTLAEQYQIEERERRRRREEAEVSDEDERSSSSRREHRSSRHFELTEAHERRRRVFTGSLRLHTEDLPPDTRKVGNASTMRRDWTSRIEPWVKRELQSILYQRDVSILLAFVEGVVTRVDINTASGFRNSEKELEPYLDHYTRTFLTELLAFVESGIRMNAYDNAIRYGP